MMGSHHTQFQNDLLEAETEAIWSSLFSFEHLIFKVPEYVQGGSTYCTVPATVRTSLHRQALLRASQLRYLKRGPAHPHPSKQLD